jgi:hypothetical protein
MGVCCSSEPAYLIEDDTLRKKKTFAVVRVEEDEDLQNYSQM